MIKKLVFFSFAFIFLACNSNNDDDGTNCTDQYVYGLSITVRDAVTEQIISENITLTATDGNYSEALMTFSGSTNFIGAGEREGTYTIQVLADGYESFTSDEIVVNADECHVITEERTFQLQPL